MKNRKVDLEFRCENMIIPNRNTLEMLVVAVGDMLKLDIQVASSVGKRAVRFGFRTNIQHSKNFLIF